MGVVLTRPVLIDVPVVVDADSVVRMSWAGVPTSVREHAWTVLGSACGPAVSDKWWTVGRLPSADGWSMVVARLTRTDGMQYGRQVRRPARPVAKVVRRGLLACTRCADVRPDADQVGQGVSRGAPCVFLDCEGVYQDCD